VTHSSAPRGKSTTTPTAREWQLAAENFPIGPHDEAFIVAAIERGEILKGQVRRMSEMRWRELSDHPPFAQALRRAADTSSGRWRRPSR